MFPPVKKTDLDRHLKEEPEGEFPLVYTLQIGRVFCAISALKTATYGALILFANGENFEKLHNQLRQSSFGHLVTRLSEKGVDGRDLRYLKAINKIRNRFVHSLFWDFPRPHEVIDRNQLTGNLISELEKIHKHLRYAEHNLFTILGRSGSVEIVELGSAGKIYRSKEKF